MGGDVLGPCQWYSLKDISKALSEITSNVSVIFQTDNVTNYSLST